MRPQILKLFLSLALTSSTTLVLAAPNALPTTDSPQSLTSTPITAPSQPTAASVVTAPSVSSGSYSIDQLEKMALASHPVIQGHTQRLETLNGEWTQAGLAPNPEFSYESEEMSSEAPGGRQDFVITQTIITNGKLQRAQAVVCSEIQTAKEALRIAQLRVQTDVRIAAIEYLTLQKKQQLLQEVVKNADQLCSLAKQMADKGEIGRRFLLQYMSQAQKAQEKLRQNENDLAAAWHKLATVMGNPNLPQGTLTDVLSETVEVESWEACASVLKETSPEIARASARIQEAQQKLQMEYANDSTDLTVGGGITYNTGEDRAEGHIVFEMPLRIRNRNQGAISAARSEVIVAGQDYERVILSVQARLAETYRLYQNAAESVKRYRESLLPQAEEAIRLTKAGTEHGEGTLLDLLDMRSQYADLYFEYLEAIGCYWTQKTLLDGKMLTGCLEDEMY